MNDLTALSDTTLAERAEALQDGLDRLRSDWLRLGAHPLYRRTVLDAARENRRQYDRYIAELARRTQLTIL